MGIGFFVAQQTGAHTFLQLYKCFLQGNGSEMFLQDFCGTTKIAQQGVPVGGGGGGGGVILLMVTNLFVDRTQSTYILVTMVL